ncbi:L-threonine aldolase [Mumia flava]|uniref:L-threonine aldolase n=1 Tax=Mumia flava TaxID=1348852 RepID=A0A2M9B759_9ACTN|nr:L-threonine aldolase [Mumia flava]
MGRAPRVVRVTTAFASDNYAPAHPAVLDAVAAANAGHAVAYGDDEWTARLREIVRHHFGAQALAFPVLNGTGANVISLASLLPRWGSVVVSDVAHVNVDENAAPERMSGTKLLTVETGDGRLGLDALERYAENAGDPHRAQPLAVSLTQSTELGTVYGVHELKELSAAAHRRGMVVHMDGSRIANAAVSLGVPLRALTTDAGIDVLSFGGTKNGIMLGEAVVVLAPEALATTSSGYGSDPDAVVEFVRKMSMQLASKMRYVSAQLVALLDPERDLWHENASRSNAAAARLRAGLDDVGAATAGAEGPRIRATQPTEANAVFALLPRDVADRVRERFRFYDWRPGPSDDLVEVRLMCSWDTTDDDVDAFLAELDAAARSESPLR